jgi:hypothetical protein
VIRKSCNILPFALSLSKGFFFFLEREREGFDRLSPNGDVKPGRSSQVSA